MSIKKLLQLLSFALILLIPTGVFASAEGEKSEDGVAKRKEHIKHHLLDNHDFHIVGNISLPLPVMFWDKGAHMAMSSVFEHGEKVAEIDGNFYKIEHSKIIPTDASGKPLAMHGEHPVEVAIDYSVTKNVVVIMLVCALMFWLFRSMAKNYSQSMVPKGPAKLLEPLILFVRDEIAIPNIGEKHYNKYMGFLLSVFFFVWIVNLIGLTPLGINVTGNIAITVALSLMTLFITLYTSKSTYWAHIFWMPGVPVPMKILLAPIELLGVIIKPFALLIRLYANIKAGHIVLMSLIAVMYLFDNWGAKGAFLGLSFFLNLIELLVAFLQAYIFNMLSALYFGAASEEHHHEEAHH